jgi:hypothetical protein
MGINIQIQIDFTPKQKKIVRVAVVSGAVVGALGLGLAVASPHQWKTSDPLTATDLNGLNVVSYTSDAGTSSYSVGATKFCAATSASYTGNMGGFVGAKQACQTACSTNTAHMCTSEEIARSNSLGINLSHSGAWWYATTTLSGTQTTYFGNCGGFCTAVPDWTLTANDCNSNNYSYGGTIGSQGGVNFSLCSDSNPIACCD